MFGLGAWGPGGVSLPCSHAPWLAESDEQETEKTCRFHVVTADAYKEHDNIAFCGLDGDQVESRLF